MTRYAALFSILLLIGAGCLRGSAPTEPVQSLNFEVRSFTKEKAVPGTGGCTLTVEYPEITDTQGASAGLIGAVNSRLKNIILGYLGEGGENNINERAQAFIDECARNISEFAGDESDPYLMTEKWTSDISFEVEKNVEGQLSVGLANAFYMGGAHPGLNSAYLVFDLRTGKTLTLQEALTDEEMQKVAHAVSAELLKKYGDALYPESLELFTAYENDPSMNRAKELLERYGEFSLTNDGVIMHYDEYEIAPYAAGPIEVEVTL